MRLTPVLSAFVSVIAGHAQVLSPVHVEEVAPGIWAAGYPHKQRSVNIVWRVQGGTAVVYGGAGVEGVDAFVAKRTGGKTVKRATDDIWQSGPVLYAGKYVTNGPAADVSEHSNSADWLARLEQLRRRDTKVVVPGRGSWGGPQIIDRQHRFVKELRRQVAYGIAMEKSPAAIQHDLASLPAAYFSWMPYDNPRKEDVAHIYAELTAPNAPFHGKTLAADKPQALVLVGDRFHEPEHLEAGLRPALEAAGVTPHFFVDYRALNAENLTKVDLLVILRDGMVWPAGHDGPNRIWMRPEQEKAVVDFVEGGKAFLNLHNSMGIYPENGPYLKLVGGNYIGHGPLERFRVEVTDPRHPITQGISTWFAADEQHTPPADEKKVHIFLKNRSDDEKAVANAGWAYEPGKGRLCHLASGHTREALEHPMYQRVLRNAIEWCLRKR
jgi:hypothetical protein